MVSLVNLFAAWLGSVGCCRVEYGEVWFLLTIFYGVDGFGWPRSGRAWSGTAKYGVVFF
jgi:hypothetical protein